MTIEHYLLMLLSILPIVYKYSFWLYAIQLKEYRWDRFKEYLSTKQWKSALINMWSVIEFPLFIISFITIFNYPFEVIIYNVLFYFFLIQNIFILRKILKKNILKPKLTSRLLLTLLLLIIWFSLDFSFFALTNLNLYLYSYLLFIILFSPLVIFFIILLTLPIVNYLKNKRYKIASEKSKKYNKAIKIWITWSYWKSSVKEYLSSILEQDWKTLKTPENINTEMWISNLIISKLSNKFKYFVAEMWAYKIGEIDTLWKIVDHKYWFLTAIWNQHIALFWNQKNIITWKSEIANSVLKNDWILYLNWNDKLIKTRKFPKELNIVKYWNSKWSDAIYKIISTKDFKTSFEFSYKKNNTTFTTDLIWEHNIINLTWVLAFCYDIWLKTTELKKYLKNITKPKNTLNVIKTKNHILIDDTYNLSESWLYAGLDSINSFNWDKTLVMDDILELWKQANEIHYVVWKFIAEEKKIKNVLFCWVNYSESFKKWLIDGWFNKENILSHLNDLDKHKVILFEWKKSSKYFNKLLKDVQ